MTERPKEEEPDAGQMRTAAATLAALSALSAHEERDARREQPEQANHKREEADALVDRERALARQRRTRYE